MRHCSVWEHGNKAEYSRLKVAAYKIATHVHDFALTLISVFCWGEVAGLLFSFRTCVDTGTISPITQKDQKEHRNWLNWRDQRQCPMPFAFAKLLSSRMERRALRPFRKAASSSAAWKKMIMSTRPTIASTVSIQFAISCEANATTECRL